MNVFPRSSTLVLFFLIITVSYSAPCTSAAGSPVDADLSYYRRTAARERLETNDRLYILNRILKKHEDAGADTTAVRAEISRLTDKRRKNISSRSSDGKRIAAGDTVRVDVEPATEFATVSEVDNNGAIYLPLVGFVSVEGLSADQAEIVLIEKLSLFVSRPIVKVIIIPKDKQPGMVHLVGAITRPGKYKLKKTPTLSQLLERGGITPGSADIDGIRIFRLDPKGERIVLMTEGNTHAVALTPADIVWVPGKKSGNPTRRLGRRGFSIGLVLLAGTTLLLLL